MINPIILAELAKTRQQDLLKEAECWRVASQATAKKSDKMGMIRRFMTEVLKRRIKFRLFHTARVNDLDPLQLEKGLSPQKMI
jgi:hypothetical protein